MRNLVLLKLRTQVGRRPSTPLNVHALFAPSDIDGRIDPFLKHMFHGVASRDGVPYPHRKKYHLGDELEFPLDIMRPGNRVPEITRTAGSLIVFEALKDQLSSLPNIDFFEVRFKKLFDYESKIGDFKHWRDPRYGGLREPETEKFIRRLKDVPEFHKRIGKYYEVILPFMPTLRKKYRESRMIKFNHCEGPVSPRLLEENAIVIAPSGYFMGDRTWEILEPYVDRDFFVHQCKRIRWK